jgi:heme exporter protein D
MGEFLKMGGYGAYVWPAYAISLAAFGALAFAIRRRARRLRRRLAEIEAAAPRSDADNAS